MQRLWRATVVALGSSVGGMGLIGPVGAEPPAAAAAEAEVSESAVVEAAAAAEAEAEVSAGVGAPGWVEPGGDVTPGALVAGPSPQFRTYCRQITDSVYRLYSAYFLREPDTSGWSYWLSIYGSAHNTNLEVIADSFAISDEFVARYGHLSNAEFVTLVYQNVMGRPPDSEGFTHWTAALDAGYHRGSVMIAFSESEEYVLKTGTLAPAAGYLTWYDRSFRYKCGMGLGGNTAVDVWLPGDIPTAHADVMTFNGDAGGPVTLYVDDLYPGGAEGLYWVDRLPTGSYVNVFNIDMVGGMIGLRIRSTDPEAAHLNWSVVYYDHPHRATRHPWGGQDWQLF